MNIQVPFLTRYEQGRDPILPIQTRYEVVSHATPAYVTIITSGAMKSTDDKQDNILRQSRQRTEHQGP